MFKASPGYIDEFKAGAQEANYIVKLSKKTIATMDVGCATYP